MMQVVKKWTVILTMPTTTVTIIIHDNFYSNMLRKLAEIGFQEEPTGVVIKG
jgi:hypothetical protein